jgi:uncharacterized protein (DUF58 family)
MPSLATLLRRLARESPATHAPLLSQEEILDLRNRVQTQPAAAASHRETAHHLAGDARSVYKGSGLDYEESRPYQPGDDARHMNWRLTARTGQLTMKVFREERRPGVFVLMDRRAAMRFGTRARLKVTQAARVATCAAFAAQQRNAALGGVILETSPHWFNESSGEQNTFALINAACAPCPPIVSSTDEPALDHILRLTQELLIPGSRVFLISDFHDLAEEHRPTLLQLAAQHTVHAVHVYDPAEQELPAAGTLRFSTPGGGIAREVDTTAAAAIYRETAAAHFERCKNLFQSLAISYTALSTQDEAAEQSLPSW